eukprot:6491379-Amphidinium_carterae.2
MSPENLFDFDAMAVDPQTIPLLGDALKTLGECERLLEAASGSDASASAAAATVHTLRLRLKKIKKTPKRKGKGPKGAIVKLEPEALSTIDEVAESISSFQSFEEEEEDDENEEAEEQADEVFGGLSSTPADIEETTPMQPR